MSEKSGGRNTSVSNNGYEYGLTQKQKFFLYLFQLCPSIDVLHMLWLLYCDNHDRDNLQFHCSVSPFQAHPCGRDSLFHPVAGFVDPDIFLDYYRPRENYLTSIKLVGHPYFLCQYKRSLRDIESQGNYYRVAINEQQVKLTLLQKSKLLELAIQFLIDTKFHFTTEQIMRYLLSIYTTYTNTRILMACPIAMDRDGVLCPFE